MLRRIAGILSYSVLFLSTAIAQDSDKGVLISPAPRTETGGQRWALIIGINDYTNVPILRFGRSDAEALTSVLINKCGFPKDNVVLMTDARKVRIDTPSSNPTPGNLSARIDQFARFARTNDLLLISFSGHGINVDGRGYLIPVDGNSRDIGSLVPLSWLKQVLESSPARQRLLVLDACHSGARAGNDAGSPAHAILSSLSGAAFATLASCDSHQLSHEDPDLGGGVFTNAVVEGLNGKADTEVAGNRDGIVTAKELFEFAYRKVTQWSLKSGKSQTPVLEGKFKGRIELARFRTYEELKSQKEELQKHLKAIQDIEQTSLIDELQKEITELEVQLNAITGTTIDGIAASDDVQMAYAGYDAAKKQVEELERLLAEKLKTYQSTSQTVAKIKEKLKQAQANIDKTGEGKRQAAKIMYRLLENQIQAKQAVYEELVREVLPTTPLAKNLQDAIDTLKKRQLQYFYAMNSGKKEKVAVIKKKIKRKRYTGDYFLFKTTETYYETVVARDEMIKLLQNKYRYSKSEADKLLSTIKDSDEYVTVTYQ